MNTNPDSYSQTIRSLILRDRLGTLGDLSESFGTATWLKNIVLKALDYPLAFPNDIDGGIVMDDFFFHEIPEP